VAKLELFGAGRCPYTTEMREWLEFGRREFVEYDVDADPQARARLRSIAPDVRTVPVLVEDGRVLEVGFRGRGCMVER
jgi:glutaredoxin 3